MIATLLLALLGTAHAQSAPAELELAYQREFAYLQAEKQALTERRRALEGEESSRSRQAEGALGSLQAKLLSLQSRREQLEESLDAAQRDADGATEAADLVESTLFQAQSTLEAELPEGDDLATKASALKEAYGIATDRLAQAGQVRIEDGTWFRANGTKVDGQMVRVGGIAAYGVGVSSGTLLPVGEGKFQLRDDDPVAAQAAQDLAAGRVPASLPIFLFEDAAKRIDEAPAKTMWTWLAAGGVVGYVIMALGLAAGLLSVLRFLGLTAAGRGQDAVQAAIAHLDGGRWSQADKLVHAAPGAGPRMMAALLPLGPGDTKRLEDRASEALLLETPALDRFGTAIMVIAAVAPLLGLLGTVTGMIGTFEIITEFGTGDPRMLSGGISEALVTTQMGLIVAIPSLLLGNLLNRQADAVLGKLELAALAVINRSGAGGTSRPSAPPTRPTDDVELVPAHG